MQWRKVVHTPHRQSPDYQNISFDWSVEKRYSVSFMLRSEAYVLIQATQFLLLPALKHEDSELANKCNRITFFLCLALAWFIYSRGWDICIDSICIPLTSSQICIDCHHIHTIPLHVFISGYAYTDIHILYAHIYIFFFFFLNSLQFLPRLHLQRNSLLAGNRLHHFSAKWKETQNLLISWSPCDLPNFVCDKQYLNISKVQTAWPNYNCTARNVVGIDSATTVLGKWTLLHVL